MGQGTMSPGHALDAGLGIQRINEWLKQLCLIVHRLRFGACNSGTLRSGIGRLMHRLVRHRSEGRAPYAALKHMHEV